MADLSTLFWEIVRDPAMTQLVRRTLDTGVVLDTWMCGAEEEQLAEDALSALLAEEERLTAQALATHALFPTYPMPPDYVHAAFHELLFSTALYHAQRTKGVRHVDAANVRDAAHRVRALAEQPQGLTHLGQFFLMVSSHEDLNALDFYGRMHRDDFLQGRLHRPWSNTVLSAQLAVYRRLNLVDQVYTGTGDRLRLTPDGREALTQIHARLEEAGELAWRAETQRWVIFGETNYDEVFSKVFPDGDAATVMFLDSLDLTPGMRVLEVGCGTGRATVDLGLCDRVRPGGSVTALDPNRVLLQRLADKCRDRGVANVEIVQGRGEELPFLDGHFDAAIAVGSLHFTDWERVVAEMVRVTKPGGLIAAAPTGGGFAPDPHGCPVVPAIAGAGDALRSVLRGAQRAASWRSSASIHPAPGRRGRAWHPRDGRRQRLPRVHGLHGTWGRLLSGRAESSALPRTLGSHRPARGHRGRAHPAHDARRAACRV